MSINFRIIRLFLCVAPSVCLIGCTSPGSNFDFAERFDHLNTGLTRAEVIARIGDPTEKRDAIVTSSHPPTVESRLSRFFPLGTPCEIWEYHRGASIYYVYFASGSGEPKELWRVVLHESQSVITPPPY